jgi:hypothetical protein
MAATTEILDVKRQYQPEGRLGGPPGNAEAYSRGEARVRSSSSWLMRLRRTSLDGPVHPPRGLTIRCSASFRDLLVAQHHYIAADTSYDEAGRWAMAHVAGRSAFAEDPDQLTQVGST